MKESMSVRALDQRLQNVAGKDQILAYRLRVTVANVVVGQMLPPGRRPGFIPSYRAAAAYLVHTTIGGRLIQRMPESITQDALIQQIRC
jgi:hypothetical protein